MPASLPTTSGPSSCLHGDGCRRSSSGFLSTLLACSIALFGLLGCSASKPRAPIAAATPGSRQAAPLFNFGADQNPPVGGMLFSPNGNGAGNASAGNGRYGQAQIMLGIDVLEHMGFAQIKGKRVGLLTHPAGVNRRGERTIDVLRRAPGVKLVALYGPEHGINGDAPAEIRVPNSIDARTGLPVFSVYGQFRKPTKAMLQGIDALLVDLQDIGTRSYTFVSAMRLAMEACFENGVECVVLDRPNPLGGLKVDGPPLEPQWTSYVGAFRVPYVHGLTIGELARMAKEAPGVLDVTDAVRQRGRLTVIPMRGWTRAMRWPETGLRWIQTSKFVPDFAAVMGYPMTGLGTYLGGFRHGVGGLYPFRGLSHLTVPSEVVEREVKALNIPGIRFQRITVPGKNGKPSTGLFIEITNWDAWNPCELNFHLMKLACRLEPRNPFLAAPQGQANGFLRHVGSTALLEALKRDGARTDIQAFLRDWQARARIYQQQSRRYWLYQ